ncbi:hypothetical protein HRbin02_01883 [Candidatus Calditenuaceae archaeon HR02]|nr:hypothetical protein HRbin02_01883 [Candidatus Calditenuaceae archaeon HR02]
MKKYEEIYDEVLRLRKEGASYYEIRNILQQQYSLDVPKSTLSYWLRHIHTPKNDGKGRPKSDQRLNKLRNCPETGYTLGAYLGDGYKHYEVKAKKYMVLLPVKDKEFAEEFARSAAVALGRSKPYRAYYIRSEETWLARAYSRELYLLSMRVKDHNDISAIIPYVEHCQECVKSFIRGFADAEGGPIVSTKRIKISNTNLQLLRYIKHLLQQLGIYSRIYYGGFKSHYYEPENCYITSKKALYELHICRKEDIRRYAAIIGFTVDKKRIRLQQLLQAITNNPT